MLVIAIIGCAWHACVFLIVTAEYPPAGKLIQDFEIALQAVTGACIYGISSAPTIGSPNWFQRYFLVAVPESNPERHFEWPKKHVQNMMIEKGKTMPEIEWGALWRLINLHVTIDMSTKIV
jgi:hypothetical protein